MISDEYLSCLKATRAAVPYWGSGGARHAEPIVSALQDLGVYRGSILDYGSGVGMFSEKVRELYGNRYAVTNYEPTLPQWSKLERGPFNAVACTHVLEHVEPDLLGDTLKEIRERATHLVFLEIPFGPAKESLVDGRNAHLTQEPLEWWLARLDTWIANAHIDVKLSTTKLQAQFSIRF